MSLPTAFENATEYFQECMQFFEEYLYLYNVPNIEILTYDVFNKIDVNEEQIDVFNENIDLTQIDDEFLKTFFSKLTKLHYYYESFENNETKCDINVPLSRKKKHEIIYLADVIKGVCENVGCDVVVDLGSGLGYLDQQLYEITNYKVLGIDCNVKHHVGAKNRQRKYNEQSKERVKHVLHTVSADSHENINAFLKKKFVDVDTFCITGLHACADLSIDAVDIFLKMDNARAIVIMPCCYHKMIIDNGRFRNFPISKCLKDLLDSHEWKNNLGVPFLRLAAHPQSLDMKLKDMVFNSLSRAILQLYAYRRNCHVKRNKRKPVNTKILDNDFDRYAENAINEGFKIVKNDDYVSDEPFDIIELKALWNEMAPGIYKKAGIYILLQNYLQPVVENFVLYDRLVYLQENCVANCRFQKILDEKVSPRCLALVAYKDG